MERNLVCSRGLASRSNLNARNLHWAEVLAETGVKERAVLGWGQASILSMDGDLKGNLKGDLDGVLPLVKS
jgi:hypothetical protein